MSYEMTALLMKCKAADYEFLVAQVDSYVNFSSDKELTCLLSAYQALKTDKRKLELSQILEREIRYLGSSEIAYAYRKYVKGNEFGGVSAAEIVSDVSKKLKIKQKTLGTLEAKVERLVKYAAEKTFFSLTSEQQRELFTKAGVGKGKQEELLDKLKQNKARFLPLLLSILGPEITAIIVQSLAVSAIAAFIGRKAAEELIKHLATRFPWWAEWLGPIVWGLSLAWLALDLQSAASRKTIPILLYLGIVGLRDGPVEGDKFWEDAE
ncbi:hypothetical protein [Noviherbaspirillum sp. Root189]|uniref:hypothetical protein n=1 Tax=Noviherbaspirillum sp. Root189 TaxID=1736487 RepID=UPI0007126950|nr:hypothetical protein [Noviherbaspirillum sp. Root189]KRB79060.1 hypothetical protein ASE07_05065 [Noviherbaspirillum sp. Root189]